MSDFTIYEPCPRRTRVDTRAPAREALRRAPLERAGPLWAYTRKANGGEMQRTRLFSHRTVQALIDAGEAVRLGDFIFAAEPEEIASSGST